MASTLTPEATVVVGLCPRCRKAAMRSYQTTGTCEDCYLARCVARLPEGRRNLHRQRPRHVSLAARGWQS